MLLIEEQTIMGVAYKPWNTRLQVHPAVSMNWRQIDKAEQSPSIMKIIYTLYSEKHKFNRPLWLKHHLISLIQLVFKIHRDKIICVILLRSLWSVLWALNCYPRAFLKGGRSFAAAIKTFNQMEGWKRLYRLCRQRSADTQLIPE